MSLPNIFCKIVYDARLAGNRTKHRVGVNALSSGTEYFASVRTFRYNSVQLSFDYIDFRDMHLTSAYKCGSVKLRKIRPRGDANPNEQLNRKRYHNRILIYINFFGTCIVKFTRESLI